MMQAYLRRTSPPGFRRKYFGGGTSAKSSRSMKTSRVNGTLRVVGVSDCGLSTASTSMVSPAGMLVSTTLIGSTTARRRRAIELSSSRTACSYTAMSVMLSNFVTPTPMAKRRRAQAGTPRRRMPLIVGRRGSSQPLTSFSLTRWMSLRFETIMWLGMSFANSYWCGSGRGRPRFSRIQS